MADISTVSRTTQWGLESAPGGGVFQVETATVVGTITLTGDATVIVTAAGMSGSPITLSVGVINADTASMVATKIRAAFAANSVIQAFFTIGGTGAAIILTRTVAAANDATLNVSIDNGTCTGLTTAATSANTTAGVASGPGTTPTVILSTIGTSRFKPTGAGEPFAPMGSKVDTASIPPGREGLEMDLDAVWTYDEINYIFASAIDKSGGTATADGTNGKKRIYTLSKLTNTKQSYTVEQVHTEHSQKGTYCQVSDLTLNFGWQSSDSKVTAKLLGQRITDDVVATPALSGISYNLVSPQTWDVYNASSQAGLASATGFGRAFKASLTIPDIVGPLNRMASSDVGFIALLEKKLSMAFKLTTDADDAGMAFLANFRAGTTTFFRLKSLGAVIAGGTPSQFTIIVDVAVKVNKPYTPSEEQSVAEAAEWDFDLVYDSTWGNILSITTISELASM
jgi:hypothetical protein